jgi:hypothetical protein
MTCPGSESMFTLRSTGLIASYPNETFSKRTLPVTFFSSTASAFSVTADSASRMS